MHVTCACICGITSVHRASHKDAEAVSQRTLCLFGQGLINLLCAAGKFNMPWSAYWRCGIENRDRRTNKCTTQFTHQQIHYLLSWLKVLIYIKIHNNIAPTCFGL